MCCEIGARGFRTVNVWSRLAYVYILSNFLGFGREAREGGGGRLGREGVTFDFICPKFTPSSSNSGGSPSYPSVPKAASHPVLNPPCSPIRPLGSG